MLLDLFLTFVKIGLLSIGGGYASLPYIQSLIVEGKGWLDSTTYGDLLTISQMTPGPLAINSASFVGMKVAGPVGAVVATLGNVLPSFVIVLIFSMIYYRYKNLNGVQLVMKAIRPVVVALIASVAYSLVVMLGGDTSSVYQFILLILAFVIVRSKKINTIWVIFGTGLVNLLLGLLL
ncbi:chromate transporter [Streptococcus himalayensis]|uniref:Chromate transporter n=1 Tax=Streptococcus himalayensis TaxID=1888195 RepID=A0A917A8C3_9STRE|nr:chromate transporter [Streptococcus himalayensis]GGE32456.1 chromate transporter [Streptococcus himalayensis]